MVKEKYYKYAVYGLTVTSDIEMAGFPSSLADTDVMIRLGKVPVHIDEVREEGVMYQAGYDALLLKIDNVACFLVKSGKEIIIDKHEGATDGEIQLFLMGSAFGALLQQRNNLTIHGSAIAHNGNAYIFAGTSGAGKSTLANAFCKDGYPLLADDICAITGAGDDNLLLYPGYPRIKLWENVLQYYNASLEQLQNVRSGIKKYYYDMSKQFFAHPLPLKHIFILRMHNKDEILVKTLRGMDKFMALKNNTYRYHFLKGMGKEKVHFELCSKTAEKVSVTEVFRPVSPMEPEKLAQKIKEKMI